MNSYKIRYKEPSHRMIHTIYILNTYPQAMKGQLPYIAWIVTSDA